MKYLRPARVAAVVVAGTIGFGAQTSWSGAEEPVEGVYGMVEAIDPLVGFDWAPPVQDPDGRRSRRGRRHGHGRAMHIR